MNLVRDYEPRDELLEILHALVGSVSDDRAPVETEQLARFVCGWSTAREETETVEALVKSFELRMSMINLQRELTELSTQPWTQIENSGKHPALVACLRDALRISLETYERLGAGFAVPDWDVVAESATSEALAVRAAFRAVGASLQTGLLRPRFASVRSAEPLVEDVVSFGEGHQSSIRAEVTAEGALQVSGTCSEAALNGASINISLVDPAGGSLPLGRSAIAKSSWQLRLARFGSLMGIRPGPLPSKLFALSTDDQGFKRGEAVIEHDGVMLHDMKALDNLLTFRLSVPEAMRSERPSAKVSVSVATGPILLKLGEWAVCEVTDAEMFVRIPFPRLQDGIVDCPSVFQVTVED